MANANRFPLAYSNETTYGGSNNTHNENPYYYIHTASNASIFTQEDPAIFDVYNFAEDSTSNDSPTISYSLVIIKNMGASASNVTVDSMSIFMNSENESVSESDNPWSFVNSLNDIHTSSFSAGVGILTPDEFDNVTGPSGETNSPLIHTPLGYLKIDIASGNVNENSFDGTGLKYIPFYRTNQVDTSAEVLAHGQSLCDLGNQSEIGAKNINGTVYPEYAAFLIKCKPLINMDTVGGNLQIIFSNPSTIVDLELHVTAYKKGYLAFEQGFWQHQGDNAPQFVGLNGELGTVEKVKPGNVSYTASTVTPIIDWVNPPSAVSGAPDNVSQNFPITDIPAFGENFAAVNTFNLIDRNPSIALKDMVCKGFYPLGYAENASNSHITNPQDNIAYWRHVIRVYDSSDYTGGIRFIHGDRIEVAQNFYHLENNTDNNSFVFQEFPFIQSVYDNGYEGSGDAPLIYARTLGYNIDTSLDAPVSLAFNQQLLGNDLISNTRFYTLGENEEIYIKIAPILSYSEDIYYRTGDNANAYLLHPNTGSHFTTNTSQLNRRVNIVGIPVFYNPFWISDGAALDGVNEEEVYRETLYFATGAYYVWSTNVDTLSRFGRVDNIDNLTGAHAAFALEERLTGRRVTENVAGAILIPDVYNTNEYKETTLDLAVTNATSTSINEDGNNGPQGIWKHKHIYDYFSLPAFSADIISPYMQLQFNNISGNDNFYCSDFRFFADASSSQLTKLNYLNEAENFQIISFTNDKFKPYQAADINQQNNITDSQILDVFAPNSTTLGSFDNLTGNCYLAGAQKKTIHIKIKYNGELPESSYTEDFDSWDGRSLPQNVDTDDNFDAIGRYSEATNIIFSSYAIDLAHGGGNATQVYAGNLPNAFKLYAHGNKWKPIWRGFEPANLDNSSGINETITGSTSFINNPFTTRDLYITSYPADNTFGTHSLSASNIVNEIETGALRTEYAPSHLEAACQLTAFTTTYGTPNANNNTHDLKLPGNISGIGLTGHFVQYANTNYFYNYYYRKYPLNGPSCFKYERYFKDRVLHTQITNSTEDIQAGLDNSQPYGIIPGPLAEGKFKANGDAFSLKALTGTFNEESFEPSKKILFAHMATLIQQSNVYEVSIPFNIQNSNYEGAQIVSIDLENKVGTAGSSLYGVARAYGDPRYINGDSTKGVYKTSLHINQKGTDWSAPHLGGGHSPTMTLTGNITNGYEFTYVADFATNPTYMKVITKMKVSGSGIPAGTHAWIHSGTVLHLKDGVSSSASNVTATNATGVTLTFDYPAPEYAIWDIIGHPNTPSARESLYKSNLVFGNTVKLRSMNSDAGIGGGDNHTSWFIKSNQTKAEADAYAGLPEEKFINNEMFQIGSFGSNADIDVIPSTAMTINNAGTFDVGIWSTTPANVFNDQKSLYQRYQQFSSYYFYNPDTEEAPQASGVPCIYFSIDNSKLGMIDADTLSDFNNEIDSGTYINRLRIRYILHTKLDAYGVNQQKITGSTTNGINYLSANLDEVHVYEDTYLIAVNFTNVTPEIRIIDVEGEIRTDGTTLDFGTMRIG